MSRTPPPEVQPGALIAMSDEGLRADAVGLLQLLEAVPGGDSMETELRKELRLILCETP
jgi:hypothetical protein